ncbi:MAG: hypothetical protein FWC89_13595 [Defluviitaleaceae bacterium]|nr:hypothetical protein [Defluviitaleaceae bacterium]
MRKVEDCKVLSFNEITSKYKHDYCVVEVISINRETGVDLGKVLWLCDNLEDALDLSFSIEDVESMVLPGLACYSVLGGCFV